MIDELDNSLRDFLGAALGAATRISFEAPAPDWPRSTDSPTVSCFLHEVVEDIERRPADWCDVRGDDGRVAGRRPPLRHYRFHYLVSAWADGAEAEHRILGQVMTACLATETIPGDQLCGVLADQEIPVRLALAAPAGAHGVRAHQIWSSLGVALRASLALMVEATMQPGIDTDIAPEAKQITLGMERLPANDRPRPATRPVTPAVPGTGGPGTGRPGTGRTGTEAAGRSWTAFRVREQVRSDDAGLDGVGDGV